MAAPRDEVPAGTLARLSAFVHERGQRAAARRTILAHELGIDPPGAHDLAARAGSGSTPAAQPEPLTDLASASKDLAPANEGEEEEVYTGSRVFLKGMRSDNPHNDYSQHFVNTGQRPQNAIRDSEAERYTGYPRMRELVQLKTELLHLRATPPFYVKADLAGFPLTALGSQFDVILIDPPLPEYARRGAIGQQAAWTWDKICSLEIDLVGAQPSFVFLWVGAADGLEEGRRALRRWGYKRCEDICWIKTNRGTDCAASTLDAGAVLQHTKEHCLMGRKGLVKRSTDGHFIHANVDLDVIVAEEPPPGRIDKPEEIFAIIERFCLGRRRLHLFAPEASLRPGWLSVGPALSGTNYNPAMYLDYFSGPPPEAVGGHPLLLDGHPGTLLGSWAEIEQLRPKSPPTKKRPVR